MRTDSRKRTLIAVAVAIALHVGLIALLYLLSLSGRIKEANPIELVLIDIGNVDAASGTEEPEGLHQSGLREAVEPTTAMREPTKPPAPIQTQTHEESLQIAEAKRKEEERQRAEAEAQEAKKREEQRRQANNAVANAFGAGRGANTSHGDAATGSGNQGSPNGALGGTFSLDGRTIVSNGGQLIRPETSRAIRGRVTVRITVNATGRVTQASVLPAQTNISDANIRQAALAAARTTVFSTQEGADEQRGTITYNFDISQ